MHVDAYGDFAVTYTIVSAVYANKDHTAAVVQTEEAGSVAVSEIDTPDQWAVMLDWGEPEPFEEPPEPIPDRVTARQFFLQLEAAGLLDDVEAWIEQQALPVQIAYARSSTFVRDDVMLQQGFEALQFTPEQVDAFFQAAAAL
jgi:hypothetical protein